jgi:hypothetical protein
MVPFTNDKLIDIIILLKSMNIKLLLN